MATQDAIKLLTFTNVAPQATVSSKWNNANSEVYHLNAWPKVAPGVTASAEIANQVCGTRQPFGAGTPVLCKEHGNDNHRHRCVGVPVELVIPAYARSCCTRSWGSRRGRRYRHQRGDQGARSCWNSQARKSRRRRDGRPLAPWVGHEGHDGDPCRRPRAEGSHQLGPHNAPSVSRVVSDNRRTGSRKRASSD